jgi:hypothetical protein
MRVLTLDLFPAAIITAKCCWTLKDGTGTLFRNFGTQLNTSVAKHLRVASTTVPRFKPEILQYSYRHTHLIIMGYYVLSCSPSVILGECDVKGNVQVVTQELYEIKRMTRPKHVGQLCGDSSNYLPCVVLVYVYGLPCHRVCCCSSPPNTLHQQVIRARWSLTRNSLQRGCLLLGSASREPSFYPTF